MPSGTETSRPPASTTRDELLYRLRQQSLLGEFGRSALQTRDMRQILQRATELCAQGLEAPFAKVLEYIPDEKRLLIRAGVGWPAGTIDHVSLGADVESPAGYAFHTGRIVVSNHLQEETRFRTPQLLAQHGVRRAINVLIARGGEGHLPFGVLEVDSADPGQFDLADADFLAGFAGLLGIAIERQHADAELQSSLDHQAMLTREMSHRVKNSLASVVGLLRVQARSVQSEDVQNALKDAASRITTIAQVHDHLWRSKQIGFVDIADFAGELCHKLQETSAGHKLHCKFGNLMISADKAVPLVSSSMSLLPMPSNMLTPMDRAKSMSRANGAVRICTSRSRIEESASRRISILTSPGQASASRSSRVFSVNSTDASRCPQTNRRARSSNWTCPWTFRRDTKELDRIRAFPLRRDARNEVGHQRFRSLSKGTQTSTH
jgi:two-component system, sensor histidine kinase PdtaS